MINIYRKHHRGFTLIEMLFAVLIFSASLVALMTIAGRGINAASVVHEQISAHYLAQEGLEVVRNKRDTNFLGGAPWDTGFANCASSACEVIYNTGGSVPTLANCVQNGQVPLCEVFVDQNTQMYVDSTNLLATPSLYARSITVQLVPSTLPVPPDSPDEYRVTSTVTWKSKNIPRSVSLTTILKKWQ